MTAFNLYYLTMNKISGYISNQDSYKILHLVRDGVLEETSDKVEELMAMIEEEVADSSRYNI